MNYLRADVLLHLPHLKNCQPHEHNMCEYMQQHAMFGKSSPNNISRPRRCRRQLRDYFLAALLALCLEDGIAWWPRLARLLDMQTSARRASIAGGRFFVAPKHMSAHRCYSCSQTKRDAHVSSVRRRPFCASLGRCCWFRKQVCSVFAHCLRRTLLAGVMQESASSEFHYVYGC